MSSDSAARIVGIVAFSTVFVVSRVVIVCLSHVSVPRLRYSDVVIVAWWPERLSSIPDRSVLREYHGWAHRLLCAVSHCWRTGRRVPQSRPRPGASSCGTRPRNARDAAQSHQGHSSPTEKTDSSASMPYGASTNVVETDPNGVPSSSSLNSEYRLSTRSNSSAASISLSAQPPM